MSNHIRIAKLFGALLALLQTALIGQERDLPALAKGLLLEAPVLQRAATFGQVSAEAVFDETFENGGNGWTKSGSWAIGAPSSGPNDGYNSRHCAATNLAGDYADHADDWLISPAIALPAANASAPLTLSIMEWFQLESGYDYGYVKISSDNGATWKTLSARDGSSGWRQQQVDLTQYAGRTVKLAFHLTADGSRNFPGWYIEQIQITRNVAAALEATMTSLDSRNFPFVFMNVAVSAEGQALPGLTKSNFTVFENNVLQSDYFEVTPPQSGGGVRLADVVFIMDNSGSMGEEISAVSDNVFNFVNALSVSRVDFALGLCRFGGYENNGNPIVEDNGILTTDADHFKNTVWQRNYANGGKEPGYYALAQSAAGFSFRPGAQKIFIIITDETPDQGGATLAQTLALLQSNAVTLFALTEASLFGLFEPLTTATNGKYFDIYSPFDQILQHITSQVSNSYVISYRSSNPAFDGTTRAVRVRVTHQAEADTATGSYVPGSVPVIRRTAATRAYHEQAWAEGTSFSITAEIVDDVAPHMQEARLYYKRTGAATYSSVPMTWHSGNDYRGLIPGSAVKTPGVDYYLTASDGVSTSSDPRTGPESNPYQIAILPNVAPVITHTPVTSLRPGNAITIRAQIEDRTNQVASAKLFYRRIGQLLFQTSALNRLSAGGYEGVIPAAYVSNQGVEYYLQATDDFGVSGFYGTADAPVVILNSQSYVQDKQAIISHFFAKNVYVEAEQDAENFVRQVDSRIIAGTASNEDLAALRRLLLVEEAAKEAFSGAESVAALTAQTTMQLATAITIDIVFSALKNVLEPLQTVPGVKQLFKGVGDLVKKMNAFRNAIRLRATADIGNRLSGLLQRRFGFSQTQAQSTALKLANKIFSEAEDELRDQAAERVLEGAGFGSFEALLKDLYLKTYEDGIPIYFSDAGFPNAGVFYLGGTENVLVFSLANAQAHRFGEDDIDVATQTIRRVKTPAMISASAGTAQAMADQINITDLFDKLALAAIIIVGVGAVIAGIIACPAGGIGCLISAIAGLGIWGAFSSLLTFFSVANIALYSTATGQGLYHLHFDLPNRLQEISEIAFDPSSSATKGEATIDAGDKDASFPIGLNSMPTLWTDSLFAASQSAVKNLSELKTLLQQERWAEAETAFSNLSQRLDRLSATQSAVNDILDISYLYNGETQAQADSVFHFTGAYSSASEIGIGFSQFALGFALLLKPHGAVKDSIVALLDSCIARIHAVAPQYQRAFNQFDAWGFQIPPIVTVTEAGLEPEGASYIATARVKNLSSQPVSNVVASLRSQGRGRVQIFSLSDTLMNQLEPLGERQLRWRVNDEGGNKTLLLEIELHPAQSPGDFQGTRRFLSQLATFEQPPGTPSTSGTLDNQNVYAYPNPFNPANEAAKLRFRLGREGNVTITIYDVANVKVRDLIRDVSMSSGLELAVEWDGRDDRGEIVANGAYFYVIESSAGEKAIGKIAVLR